MKIRRVGELSSEELKALDPNKSSAATRTTIAGTTPEEAARVNAGVAKLRDEISAETMTSERRQKVELLKALYQSGGDISKSSDEIASALVEGLNEQFSFFGPLESIDPSELE